MTIDELKTNSPDSRPSCHHFRNNNVNGDKFARKSDSARGHSDDCTDYGSTPKAGRHDRSLPRVGLSTNRNQPRSRGFRQSHLDSFEANEVLLRIDDRDYKSASGRAQAALDRAGAENEHSRFELQRLRKLESRQLASRSQMEGALRVARIADANLNDAQLALEQAQRDLSRTEIIVPFSGLVRNERVDVGQFICRGTSIATVYATDFVEVRLPIANEQLAYLNIPLTQHGEFDETIAPNVTLRASYAGREFSWNARLVRAEAEIDAKSRMVFVGARVDNTQTVLSNDPPLRVGQFVRADIEGTSADAIVELPRSAIRNNEQVLIVDSEDRLHFRDVVIMRFYRDKAYVIDGLEAGERICVSQIQTVVEGMRVNTQEPENNGLESS